MPDLHLSWRSGVLVANFQNKTAECLAFLFYFIEAILSGGSRAYSQRSFTIDISYGCRKGLSTSSVS